ncbi:hypothetical protein CLOM_g10183 [Closterium sp. NIES-68]|nr:hypothetical protein CLOM_g10183 [Closterium sp. NIES-68]
MSSLKRFNSPAIPRGNSCLLPSLQAWVRLLMSTFQGWRELKAWHSQRGRRRDAETKKLGEGFQNQAGEQQESGGNRRSGSRTKGGRRKGSV